MDNGKGKLVEVDEVVFENLSNCTAELDEKIRRKIPSVFREGEIMSIKLSKFLIEEIKEDGHMLLKLMAR